MREEVRVKGHNADNFLMMQEVGVEEKRERERKADTANVLKTVLSCMILLPRKQNMCFLNRVTYISRQMLKMLSGCFPLFTVKRRTEEMLGEALNTDESELLVLKILRPQVANDAKMKKWLSVKDKTQGTGQENMIQMKASVELCSSLRALLEDTIGPQQNSSDKQKGFVLLHSPGTDVG